VIVFLLFIPLFAFFKIRLTLDGTLLFLLLVAIYYLTFPIRKLLERFLSHFFKTASVFDQVNLYPGNEVWIAIGFDTFKENQVEQRQAFIQQCKRRQLGLIEVYPEEQLPIIILHPTFKRAFKANDFLAYYRVEHKLRKAINRVSNTSLFGTTRSRSEKYYYIKNFSRACLLVAALFLMSLPFRTPLLPDNLASNYESTPKSNNQILYEEEIKHPIDHSIQEPEKEISPLLPVEQNAPPVTSPETIYNDEPIREEVSLTTSREQLCASFPFKEQRFLIQDQIVYTQIAAAERVAFLKTLHFKDANYLFIPCSDLPYEEDLFLVHPYNPRSHLAKTKNQLERYQYIMRKNQLEYEDAEILLVSKKMHH